MRRALLIFAVLFVAVGCFAQTVDEIHYLDSATLEWTAVDTDIDGNPLLDTDVVSYEVYVYNSALSIDDQELANLSFIGGTSAPTMTMDFSGMPRAMYYAGVRALVTDAQDAVTISEIAWSYDPLATDPIQPFAYIPLSGVLILPAPTGLREAGM